MKERKDYFRNWINPISALKFLCSYPDCRKIATGLFKRKFYCAEHYKELMNKSRLKTGKPYIKKHSQRHGRKEWICSV